jgi:DNA processing protein
MDHEEEVLLARVAIAVARTMNNCTYLPLFERCGGVEGFFKENEFNVYSLFREFNLDFVRLEREAWLREAGRELDVMRREGISCCDVHSPRYPRLLKHCADAPIVLFYKGKLEEHAEKSLAIVGTRKGTERGKARVDSIVKQIVGMRYAPVIVSGLAYGIDAAAHHAALNHGLVTHAVMGLGLHTVYPASHRHLAEKILAGGGCLLSEYPTVATVVPANFLQRNRLIAGMSDAVLVAESAVKGGAMSTARQAFSYNRNVGAFPGRPDDHLSTGCNLLIKANYAHLVENVDDVLHLLGWEPRTSLPCQVSLDLFTEPEREERVREVLRSRGEGNVDAGDLSVSGATGSVAACGTAT